MFKGTMTKWPVQKLAQGTTQNLQVLDNILLDGLGRYHAMHTISKHCKTLIFAV